MANPDGGVQADLGQAFYSGHARNDAFIRSLHPNRIAFPLSASDLERGGERRLASLRL